ncbi:MAG: hypothetical protein HY566_00295 [Candidatus Kerfeldbacteria bacterium]|nr:hypothetical protein [Candidatus Kerfeldbacteria bacterium]
MAQLNQLRTSLGLDYSDGRVTAALFSVHPRHVKLVGLNNHVLQPRQQLGGSPGSSDVFRQAIRFATSKDRAHHYPKHAVVTLPDAWCYLLTIDLPDRQNDADTIRREAAQHLPFMPDELVFDSTVAATENGVTTVQVAACPVPVVQNILAVLDGTGLEATELVPAGVAALRTFAIPPNIRAAIAVFINDTSTTVMLVTDRGIPFSVSTNALQVHRVIALLTKNLRLSDTEASEAITVCGLDRTVSHGVVRKVLENDVVELANAIQRVSSFGVSLTAQGAPSVVLLGGSGGALRNLDVELRERCKLEVLLLPIKSELAQMIQALQQPPQAVAASLSALGAGMPRP